MKLIQRIVKSPLWLVLGVMFIAFTFRFVGVNWDDHSHLHPDERFLTSMAANVGEAERLTGEAVARCPEREDDPQIIYDYFNTQCSVYNPNNVALGSFAYGTLPLYTVRITAQFAADVNFGNLDEPEDWTSYDFIHFVGRTLNALADTISVLFVYLIGWRLFSVRHGIIAAFLYACAVLPIQLSHYWTVDIMSNMYFLIGLYLAIDIAKKGRWWVYPLFGLVLGAAVASRINLFPLAFLLPLAVLIRFETLRRSQYITAHNWVLRGWIAVVMIAVAGGLAFLSFRIFQPYAFIGPTFWDMGALNEKWVDDIFEVSDLSSEPKDGWPPSNQWYGRTSLIYPWWNMAVWGMGAMLGAAATIGLAALLFRQLEAGYNNLSSYLRSWQSAGNMVRKLLPTPLLLLTVWVGIYFLLYGRLHLMTMRYYLPLYGVLIIIATWAMLNVPRRFRRQLLGGVVGFTLIWAFAFTNIYREPLTRIEASEWMSDNWLATITFENADGELLPADLGSTSLRYPLTTAIKSESYLSSPFEVRDNVRWRTISMDFANPGIGTITLRFLREEDTNATDPIAAYTLLADADGQARLELTPEQMPDLEPGQYRWHMDAVWPAEEEIRYFMPTVSWEEIDAEGDIKATGLEQINFLSPYQPVHYLNLNTTGTTFRVRDPFQANAIRIPHYIGENSDLIITVDEQEVRARIDQIYNDDALMGHERYYRLDEPILLTPNAGQPMTIRADRSVFVTGTIVATEGSWDDPLPWSFCEDSKFDHDYETLVRLIDDCDGINPYSRRHFYQLPLKMADWDSRTKYLHTLDILFKADYLTISSNRFYDALPRSPDRFETAEAYYDALFAGDLNYSLLREFSSFPNILGIDLRDQVLPSSGLPDFLNELEAEEAFTVYDHPTVFIFRNDGFDTDALPEPQGFMDEGNRIALDEFESTFSPTEEIAQNSDVYFTTAIWFLGFLFLGWITFPLVYTLFPSLPVSGFGLSRGIGWMILSVVPWWLTSVTGEGFWDREALWILLVAFIALNAYLTYRHRDTFWYYLQANWRKILAYELLFLAIFAFAIIIRGVGPDLWHPRSGGEKPMDFAYLNAILRTSDFPPPNPWLAGFEINYYYLGFVVAALPIKLGNFMPEIGYNLAMVTFYSVIFVNVFTLAFELLGMATDNMRRAPRLRLTLAMVGALFVMVAGNLGAFYLMVEPEENMAPHRWYWYPTRILAEAERTLPPDVMRGSPINEVPLFSFAYGDLHAHSMALLPVTLFLVVAWALVKKRRLWLGLPLGILAALILMTNSWDVFLYVPLGAIAMLIAAGTFRRFLQLSLWVIVGGVATFLPYYVNFTLSEGTGGISEWEGARSPIDLFLLVWGIPIAVATLWIAYRAKRLLVPDSTIPVEIGIILSAVIPLALIESETAATSIMLIMLTTSSFALMLFDNRDLRFVHGSVAVIFGFLLSTEHIYVNGDVGRMNTVFKTTYQLWLWLGLIIPVMLYQLAKRQKLYIPVAAALAFMALGLIYPAQTLPARMEEDNETGVFTLNGNLFMNTLTLNSQGQELTLSRDAALVRYMRANIEGFPVIAEWQDRQYFWHNRVSVQTGFPSVIGWPGHMKQQYLHLHPEIDRRWDDMRAFYTTGDVNFIRTLVNRYEIDYIVMGELERSITTPEFMTAVQSLLDGGELEVVYQNIGTELYMVTDDLQEANLN